MKGVEGPLLQNELDLKRPDLARVKGHRLELDILQHYVRSGWVSSVEVAPRFRSLVEQNPEWLGVLEYYGRSPSHFARLMVTLYADRFFAYSDIYRIATCLDIGESSKKSIRAVAPGIEVSLPAVSANEVYDEVQAITTDFEVSTRLGQFTENRDTLMQELAALADQSTSDLQKTGYLQALSFFAAMDQLIIPGFNPNLKPRPYQARAILKNLCNGIPERTALGLFHGTRTGKTYTASGRMRYLGVDKTLIVVPAGLRSLWYSELKKYHQNSPGILVIESNPKDRDLANAEDPETHYTILSYELLARRFNSESKVGFEDGLIKELESLGFRGLIADEAHEATGIRNKTATAEVLRKLAFMPSMRHIVLATATPADRVRDIDLLIHLLDPVRYSTPIAFSQKLRDNPRLAHNALFPLMDRVKTGEALEHLPAVLDDGVVEVTLTPTQRAIYDFILRDENMHPFSKLKNLLAATTHQRLVKGLVLPPFDRDRRIVELSAAYMKWKKEAAKNPAVIFDSDYLVTNGFTGLYLAALAEFKGGISELVAQTNTPAMIDAWRGESIPAKFVAMKDQIRGELTKGRKVIVSSSAFTQGITREIADCNQEEVFTYLLRYLQDEFGKETILKIDGDDDTSLTTSHLDEDRVSDRERIRRRWQKFKNGDGEFYQILVTNDRTSSQGNDLSIQDPSVTGVTLITESLPLSLRRLIQLKSRIMSDTQLSPVTYISMLGADTLERDIHLLLSQKVLPMNILLDAVEPTDEEIRILEASPGEMAGILSRALKSPRQNLALIFDYMVGRSPEDNRQFLAKEFRPGETYEQYLTKHYDELYINGYPGNTIKAVKVVVENLLSREGISDPRIADWGSGPLVLARVLERPVASLDICPLLLQTGKKKLEDMGISMSDNLLDAGDFTSMSKETFPDDYFDIGVCSLALDCTPAGEERIKALRRMYQAVKKGGHLIFTIPQSEMDAGDYQAFLNGFKNLGLTDDLSLSGLVKGKTNGAVVFQAWMFVLRKTGELAEVDPDNFRFAFEKAKSTKVRRQENKTRGMINYRSDKSPGVENFYICEPLPARAPGRWVEKGELHDLTTDSLTRYVLDLNEGTLATYGYKKEISNRDGKQEIRLTRI